MVKRLLESFHHSYNIFNNSELILYWLEVFTGAFASVLQNRQTDAQTKGNISAKNIFWQAGQRRSRKAREGGGAEKLTIFKLSSILYHNFSELDHLEKKAIVLELI